ncbi:MAG: PAS domain S-box protein, partial [Ignavibacteria bacterium]|nr:PAS domain S-box protein [Ignavibacteria bacterium]
MSGDLESGQLDSNLSGELAEITPGLENETEDSSGESGKIGKVHLKWDDENYVPEKLLEELERYRELFESAPSGYIVMTPDFVITSVNRSSQMLLGLPESLLVKRPLTQFIVKGYQNIFYSYRLRIFKKPGRYSCELKFQKKNGPDFHGLLECHPVFDDNGCIEIRAALLDISEHKRQ